jgi:hypothetical protein
MLSLCKTNINNYLNDKIYLTEKKKLDNNIKITLDKLKELENVQKNNEDQLLLLSNNKNKEINELKTKYENNLNELTINKNNEINNLKQLYENKNKEAEKKIILLNTNNANLNQTIKQN